MQTLTYGQKVPDTGDKGSVWFPALESNFTAIDSHSHNGTNSAKIPPSSITIASGNISSASWGAVSGKTGLFSQSVTMPTNYLYASNMITFRDTAGSLLMLQTEAGTASDVFVVYCNNSALDLVAYYGV